MNIFIYGNCQSVGLKHVFDVLLGQEVSVVALENYKIMAGHQSLTDNIVDFIKSSDIVIYQPLSNEYGEYSTDLQTGVLRHAKKSCDFFSFQYIYNNGFWPFFKNGDAVHWMEEFKSKYGHLEKNNILDLYDKNLLSFDFQSRVESSFSLFAVRETDTNVNVPISQFLLENYKDRLLFLTQNHPTSFVFSHIFKSICDAAGIGYSDSQLRQYSNGFNNANLPGYYPYTNKACFELGLSYRCQFGDDLDAEKFYREFIINHF